MIDIKFLSIQDLLPTANVDYAVGITPLSLIITGEKFNEASRVVINDVDAPEFMVVSSTQILAQIPDSQRTSQLRKLAVLAEQPSITRSSLLHFQFDSFKSIKGLERLVQLFVKLLLQTPGSDKFRPTEGGGLLSAVGKNIARTDGKAIQAAVVGSITRTRDQILAIQAATNRIPADERLLSARAEALGYDAKTTTVSASIAIAAVSGRQAVTNLTF